MSDIDPTDPAAAPTVVAVVGNPRPGSRTLAAAEALAGRVAAAIGGTEPVLIDLATFAGEVLTGDRPTADAALRQVDVADVLIVATPVYKAAYTGLLKSFLDLFGTDGLAGIVAVPLVVSGSPAHTLVGEVHLRPVLVELGAVIPTRSLTVTESRLGELDDVVTEWLSREGRALRRAVLPLHGRAGTAGSGTAGAGPDGARPTGATAGPPHVSAGAARVAQAVAR